MFSGLMFFTTICQRFFQKRRCATKKLFKDLGLLIVKNNLPIQFVENILFKRLVLRLCPKLNSLPKRQFSQEILRGLIEKTS
jgi:hypothetical protein